MNSSKQQTVLFYSNYFFYAKVHAWPNGNLLVQATRQQPAYKQTQASTTPTQACQEGQMILALHSVCGQKLFLGFADMCLWGTEVHTSNIWSMDGLVGVTGICILLLEMLFGTSGRVLPLYHQLQFNACNPGSPWNCRHPTQPNGQNTIPKWHHGSACLQAQQCHGNITGQKRKGNS